MTSNDQPPPAADKQERDPHRPAAAETGPRYVVFDPETGRIVGTYGMLDALSGEYRAQSEEEIRAMFESGRHGGTEADATSGLGVLELDVQEVAVHLRGARFRVDPEQGRLVPRLRIQLTADRHAITGDGQDSTRITITVTDAEGSPDQSFAGEVRVSTTNGRLSEPGGRVPLHDGMATITLTSTPETIDRVLVTARDTQQLAVSGELELEFL
jgi:hypothetical protein